MKNLSHSFSTRCPLHDLGLLQLNLRQLEPFSAGHTIEARAYEDLDDLLA
jgi:hypothetical protein